MTALVIRSKLGMAAPAAAGTASDDHEVAAMLLSRDSLAPEVVLPGFGVLIIDHHPLFATSLRFALAARGLTAARADTDSLAEILAAAARTPAGLAVLDLELDAEREDGTVGGASLIAALRTTGWQVLAITARSEPRAVAAAIAAGAIGCLPMSASFESLIDTIVCSASGVAVMDRSEREEWLRAHSRYRRQDDDLARRLARLSTREREVLSLLAQGMLAAGIAEKLVVELSTVRTQIRAILTKLEVNSQIQAVALWSRRLQLPYGSSPSSLAPRRPTSRRQVVRQTVPR